MRVCQEWDSMPALIAPPPEQCNCQAIRAAARHVTQFYDQCLAPSGLRTSQFTVLAKLKREWAADHQRSGRRHGDGPDDAGTQRPATGARRIDHIKFRRADRRAKELTLTKAGEKRLRTAAKAMVRGAGANSTPCSAPSGQRTFAQSWRRSWPANSPLVTAGMHRSCLTPDGAFRGVRRWPDGSKIRHPSPQAVV